MNTEHLHQCHRDSVLRNRSIIIIGLGLLIVLSASLLLFGSFYVAALDSSQLELQGFTKLSQGPICPLTISYGETIQCSIDAAGEVDTYAFSANSGDVILARMSSGQCCNGRSISLYGPGGNLLISKSDYSRVEITQTLSVAGNYTLLVTFASGSGGSYTGDYELHLQKLNGPSSATPIVYGQSLTDTIDLAAEFEAHTFSASSGDVILARMSSGQCCNGREIRLYGPDGNLLISKSDYSRVEITQTLSVAGNYTLLVTFASGSGGSYTGDYELHLQKLNGPSSATPIVYGQSLTDTIDLAAEFEAHTFSASSGDVILARMSSGQCCNGREIRLYGPDGNLLISKSDYSRVEITQTLSVAGNYTLLVTFASGSGGSYTGDYELHLQKLNGPSSATPIVYGQSLTDTIDLAAEFEAHTFSASSGDVILARMSSGQCCNGREIRLYGPDGNLLISEVDYTRVEITQTLTLPGSYTFLVGFEGGSSGSLTGEYELHLQKLNGPGSATPIVYGQSLTDTIDLAAEYEAHTFSASSGDVILARMSSGQCCNSREIRLYGPDGNLLISEVDYARVEITQTLTLPGSYTFLVGFEGGSSGSLTGEYELHLQRLNGPGNAVPVAHGQTVTGTIDLAAEFGAHTFSASGGDEISARMSATQCCNGREIRLYGSDGALLVTNLGYKAVEISHTFSMTGTHTLLVSFSGGSGGSLTGSYDLSLTCLVLPCGAQSVHEVYFPSIYSSH